MRRTRNPDDDLVRPDSRRKVPLPDGAAPNTFYLRYIGDEAGALGPNDVVFRPVVVMPADDTARAVDDFLDDPSTGRTRTRPEGS